MLAGGFRLTACQSSSDGESEAEGPSKRISTLFQPLPDEVPELGDGPVAEVRVGLGHKLYFEPKLSRSGNVSCNTCHVVGAAGVDHRQVSKGVGDRKGRRNSPTVYNAAFLESQFLGVAVLGRPRGYSQGAGERAATGARGDGHDARDGGGAPADPRVYVAL